MVEASAISLTFQDMIARLDKKLTDITGSDLALQVGCLGNFCSTYSYARGLLMIRLFVKNVNISSLFPLRSGNTPTSSNLKIKMTYQSSMISNHVNFVDSTCTITISFTSFLQSVRSTS